MASLWFGLLAVVLTLYILFDGFDLGVGILHLVVGRTDGERGILLRSIGPVWDGNELWLIAGGGTLYFAFPRVFASALSGLYLPLTIMLWLLVFRGIAIELRGHVAGRLWRDFWDGAFSLASLGLTLLLGATLGNLLRGVGLDAKGRFFAPLWTDFQPGPHPGFLDGYTVSVALAAALALTVHGALWIALKTDGQLVERARRVARLTWPALALAGAGVTGLTFWIQPQVMGSLRQRPLGLTLPALALSGLVAVRWFQGRSDRKAFFASCTFLFGSLMSAAFGMYPYLLASAGDPSAGLTVARAAAPDYGLRVGLVWWAVGMALVAAYFMLVYRSFAGRVGVNGNGKA